IEKFAREKTVCVVELAAVRRLGLGRLGFGIAFGSARLRRTPSRLGARDRRIERNGFWCRWFVDRLSAPHLRRFLLPERKRNRRKNQRCLHEANHASSPFHF